MMTQQILNQPFKISTTEQMIDLRSDLVSLRGHHELTDRWPHGQLSVIRVQQGKELRSFSSKFCSNKRLMLSQQLTIRNRTRLVHPIKSHHIPGQWRGGNCVAERTLPMETLMKDNKKHKMLLFLFLRQNRFVRESVGPAMLRLNHTSSKTGPFCKIWVKTCRWLMQLKGTFKNWRGKTSS